MEILSDSVFKGQVRFDQPVDFRESEFHYGQAFFNSQTRINQLYVNNVSSNRYNEYDKIIFDGPERHDGEVSFTGQVYMTCVDVSGPLEVCGSEVHRGPGPVSFQSSGYDFEINNMHFSVKNGSANLLGNKFTANGIESSSTGVWSIMHGSYTNTFPQKSGTIALTSDVGLRYCSKSIDFEVPSECTKFWMSGFRFQSSGQVMSAQVFKVNDPIVGPADGLCSNSSVVSMDITAIDGGHFLLEKSSGITIPSSTTQSTGSYGLRVVYYSDY